jgi:predicted NBD/HSP70 family sugar kinase
MSKMMNKENANDRSEKRMLESKGADAELLVGRRLEDMDQYLGFDIGGSFVKYGVMMENGEIICHDKLETKSHEGIHSLLSGVLSVVDQVRLKYPVKYISIATTGIVDVVNGSILNGINSWITDYSNLNIKNLIEENTGLVTEVENDVNCVALAESWLGSGVGYSKVVCLTIGTGIGGAFLLDGYLYRGSGYMAMEVGRIPLFNTTLEDLASVRAMIFEYAKLKNLPSIEGIDGIFITEQARKGDDIADRVIDMMCRYLAEAIGCLTAVLNPEVIILGGAIANEVDLLDNRLREHMSRIMDKKLYESVAIKYAKLGNHAGIVGSMRHHQRMTNWRKTN